MFTRNLADITHRLPEVVEVVRRMPVRDVILDGETLALDEDGGPRPFQDTMSRFGAETATRDAAASVVLRRAARRRARPARRAALDAARASSSASPGEHRIPGEVTTDPEVAERVSRDALAAGQEGVVVKAIDSPYAAGRRGSSWIKVKPVHTYDLVVLAVRVGFGPARGLALQPAPRRPRPRRRVRRAGRVRDGRQDVQGPHRRAAALADRDVPGRSRCVAPPTRCGSRRPSWSRSRSTACSGRPRYPGGIALRFARVKRYRDDKRPEDADTIQTLRGLLRGCPGLR